MFEPGNKLAKGGKRAGAGRPKTRQVEIKKAAAVLAREYIEQNVQPVLDAYLGLATGSGKRTIDPPTTRHFIDKLLPEIKPDGATRPIGIQIIVEQPAHNGNGNGLAAPGAGNGRAILTVGD